MGTLLKALSSHSTLCPIQSALRLSSEGGRGEHIFRLSGFSVTYICSHQFIEQGRDPGIVPSRQHRRCAPSSSPTAFSAHKLVKLYQDSIQSCCPKNINILQFSHVRFNSLSHRPCLSLPQMNSIRFFKHMPYWHSSPMQPLPLNQRSPHACIAVLFCHLPSPECLCILGVP